MKRLIILGVLLFNSSCSTNTASGLFKPKTSWNWITSCSVDPGSIAKSNGEYTFRTSKNRCYKKGTTQITGIFRQRAEIATTSEKLPANESGAYEFKTRFTLKETGFLPTKNKFDIFQIHDGRNGCAPPLKVGFNSTSRLYVRADYKTGDGESCVRNAMYNTGTTPILRNGTAYTLRIIIDFDGAGSFDVSVYLNDVLEIEDTYTPPKTGFKSKYFFFKHGVYSQNIFDYELKSKFTLTELNS